MERPPDRSRWTKLASVPVGDGREAAIWRDEGGQTRISHGVPGSTITRPMTAWEPDVHQVPAGALLSGHLPPGAVAVDLRTTRRDPRDVVVAAGAYLAMVDAPIEVVRAFASYRDARGDIIRVDMTGVLGRHPVSDATSPCPACDAVAWELLDVDRYDDPDRNRRAIGCSRCGFVEPGFHDAAEDELWDSDADDERVEIEGDAPDELAGSPPSFPDDPVEFVAQAPFPLYGMVVGAGGSARLTGWSSHGAYPDEVLSGVHIETFPASGGRVLIRSGAAAGEGSGPPIPIAHLLAIHLENHDREDEPWPTSHAALRLSSSARERDAERQAAQADHGTVDILVDDRPVAFELAGGDAWIARADVGAVSLQIFSRGVPPDAIRLLRIEDARAYLGRGSA